MEAPLALYRRYRPETFAEVIGQDHVTAPLRNALSNNRVNHAYLFSGPRGCGKTTSARILARAINCEKGPIAEPCGVCKSCTDLARGGPGSIDVIEIDAASHGGVDDARDLRERAFFAPVESRYKIYIIDEAHMVTTQGFNALLKLVEEPPPHLKFIFATTEPDKVIGTIRSRTHHYPFRLVPPKVLGDYMASLCESEGVAIEPAALPLVVRAGAGSVRDSLSVLDQLIGGAGPDGVTYELAVALLGFTPDSLLDACVDGFAAHDSKAVFETIEKVIETGQDPKRFAEDLLRRLRDLVVLSAVPNAVVSGLIEAAEDQGERLQTQAAGIGSAELTRAADIVAAGLLEMRGATAPRLQLELICAKVLLPGADDSTNGIQARLDRLERRLAIAVPGTADAEQSTGYAAAPAAGPNPAAATSRAAARAAAGAGGGTPTAGGDAPAAATAAGTAPTGAGGAGPASATSEQPTRGVAGPAGATSGQPTGGVAGPAAATSGRPTRGGAGSGGAGRGADGAAAGTAGRTGAWADESTGTTHSATSAVPEGAGPGGAGAEGVGPGGVGPEGVGAEGVGPGGVGPGGVGPGGVGPGGAGPGGAGPVASGSAAAGSGMPGSAAGPSSGAQPSGSSTPAAAQSAGSDAGAGGSGAAAAPSAGSVGLADIRRLWPEVLEAVKAKRRFAWIMLSQNAQVIAIDDQTLTLGLVNAGARESFARSGSDEILRQAMIDTIGLNRRIEAVVDPSTDPGAGAGGSQRSGGPHSGPTAPGGAAGAAGGGAGGVGGVAGGAGGVAGGGPQGASDRSGSQAAGGSGGDGVSPGSSGRAGSDPGNPANSFDGPGSSSESAGPGSSSGSAGPGSSSGRTGQWSDGPAAAIAVQEPPDLRNDVPPEPDPWDDDPASRPAVRPGRSARPAAEGDRAEQAAGKRRAAEAAVAAEQARRAAAAPAAPEVPLSPEEEADAIGEDDLVLEEDSRSHTDLLRETLGAQIITEEPN
ncbi:DNA polymerase III subunit gamma and tau [Kribbella swartbergensis]